MCSRIFFMCALVGFSFAAMGQDIAVKGRFLSDTISIGQPTAYVLTARHPADQAIVYPDSLFNFKPFEFHHKTYFTTRTREGVSIDSVVYFLNTFEIDSLQSLNLPIFLLNGKDSTTVTGEADTVALKQMVGDIPPSVEARNLPLKSNADYLSVKWLLNYPLLLIIAGITLVVLVIVWLIFGKRIRKYYQAKRLLRRHHAFVLQFNASLGTMKDEAHWSTAETTLVSWKKYMESLLSKPFTRQTTKEILRAEETAPIAGALRQIDKIVYARQSQFDLESFQQLLGYTEQQFNKKSEDLKHG